MRPIVINLNESSASLRPLLPSSLSTATIDKEVLLLSMPPSPPPALLLGAPSPSLQPEWFDPVSVLFLLLGLFFVLFGLASHLIRGKFFIPSSVVATLFGECTYLARL